MTGLQSQVNDLPVPRNIDDAFRMVLGETSLYMLRSLWKNCAGPQPLVTLVHHFLHGLAFSLPEVSNNIVDPLKAGVSPSLNEHGLFNVFERNPHACGIGACLVHLGDRLPKSGGRQLTEAITPLYLSFVCAASENIVEDYREVLNPERIVDESTALGGLSLRLEAALNQAVDSQLRSGIQHLFEAVMIVRDRRVEEVPLTIDLGLPLCCSWESILEQASAGEDEERQPGSCEPRLADKQSLLKSLAGISTDQLVEELEDIGKHVGRGVARLDLRSESPSQGKGLFRIGRIWKDHSGAPLALLYDLDWHLPDPNNALDVRLVLLSQGTVTVLVQGDPFFEYLRGNWRYVDVLGKTRHIASTIEQQIEIAETLVPSIYRVARVAYQLAYHNHGATIELDLSPLKSSGANLQRIRTKWDIQAIEDEGLPLLRHSSGTDVDGLPEATGAGRLAYALSTRDGVSIWHLKDNGLSLDLHEFGMIVDVNRDATVKNWIEANKRLGLMTTSLGGGRHISAYQRSLEADGKRMVFCVSQDGYIDVYSAGNYMSFR